MGRKRKKKGRRRPRPADRPAGRDFSNRPLAGLSQLADRQPAAAAEPRAPAGPAAAGPAEPRDDETDAFSEAMAGVEPLDDGPGLVRPEPRPAPRPSREEQEAAEVQAALSELVAGERPLSIHETDEAIAGLAEGADPRLLRRLQRGEFSIQDHLDLHGLSRQEAKPEVDRFIARSLSADRRCVLIIHGRGHGSKDKIPVLKQALGSWLVRSALRKHILAFSTARACDGGAGAVTVLLRRSRRR